MSFLGVAQRTFYCLASWVLLFSAFGWSQSTAHVTVPTGSRPLGIASIGDYVAVANSGDDSVAIFQINSVEQTSPLTLIVTVTGIPSPYGVFGCGYDDTPTNGRQGGTVLVTSPSDNSVRVLKVPEGQILGTVSTGLQPHSAACFRGAFSSIGPPLTAVVSNVGESTLTFFDVDTIENVRTLQGVPGTLGFHGITTLTNQLNSIFIPVAGTEASIVTRAGPTGIGAQVPVPRPISTFVSSFSGSLTIVSVVENGIAIMGVSAVNEELRVTTGETFRNVPNPRDALQVDTHSVRGWVATTGDSLWTYFSGTEQVYAGIPEATAMTIIYRPPPTTTSLGTPVLLVTSPESNKIFAFWLPNNRPSSQLAIQSASSVRTAASGSLASAFVATGISQEFHAGSLPLPTTLGGVSVSVGGQWNFDWTTGQWSYLPGSGTTAGLLYVGPTQINFQVPPGIPQGMIVTQIQKPDGSSLTGTIDVLTTSPSIFTVSQDGQGQAAALNQDNSANSISNPAPRGSVLQLYLTGAGPTDPPLAPGEAADPFGDPLVLTQTEPTVTINARPARVLFSGLAPGYVGLWQINVEIPADTPTGPPVPLQVSAGGRSSNIVTIAVQ